jgi:hypothetical protein
MLSWNEQKEQIKNLLAHHSDTKNKESSNLKNQINLLQKEIEEIKNSNEKNLSNILISCEAQINMLKDREVFNLKQNNSTEEKFRSYKEEKDRTITFLKEEIKNLKKNFQVLNKVGKI